MVEHPRWRNEATRHKPKDRRTRRPRKVARNRRERKERVSDSILDSKIKNTIKESFESHFACARSRGKELDEKKGQNCWAIGLCTAEIVDAIVRNTKVVLPASTHIHVRVNSPSNA